MDKSLLFLILALGCVYLILSEVTGDKLISQFCSKLFKNGGDEVGGNI